jgi:diguanylate cyclase (GGDEF)-like protein
VAEQEDLVVAKPFVGQAKVDKVTFDFKHVLSKVGFSVIANNDNNVNITIKKKWYSLEYKLIDKQEFIHIFACDKAFSTYKDDVTLNQEDPLSGLLHKIAFKSYVEHQLEENQIQAGTLFMIDIDYFKNINDNYGHMFGDEVIKEVSDALKTISEKATVGRIGGDEFAIFIEDDLERESIKNYARLIRYLLGRIVINKEAYPITSTIGISQYPKNGKTFDELYDCCDKALYRGKTKGRDCHIIYDSALHENVRSNEAVLKKVSYATGSVSSFIHEIVNRLLVDNLNINHIVEISDKIAKYFNLDRIVITGFHDVHIVCETKKTTNPKPYYIQLDSQKYFKLFTYNDSFVVNDVHALKIKDDVIGKIYIDAGVNSFIQVLIKDENNQPLGFISYEVLDDKRVWQVGEINNLVIISNIINSFLLKYKINIK